MAKQFRLETIIAHGTFSIVYSATSRITRRPVAIKRIFQDKRFKNRELELLRFLNETGAVDHPNLLKVQDYFLDEMDNGDLYLHLVTELYQDSMHSFIESSRLKNE